MRFSWDKIFKFTCSSYNEQVSKPRKFTKKYETNVFQVWKSCNTKAGCIYEYMLKQQQNLNVQEAIYLLEN